MPLNKQPININFVQGLDLKSDPKQVPVGKFLSLENSIFTKTGLFQKRNGYVQLSSLPDSSSTYSTTFNGNLTAIGNTLQAYSQGSETWINKGALVPIELSTLPIYRSNISQIQCDSVVAPNGLVCTAYTNVGPTYLFVVTDSVTGQNIVAPTVISANESGSPRVFVLGNYFIIAFTATISAAAHLQYIAVNYNTLTVGSPTDISTAYTPASTVAFDGFVANNNLYLAWNGNNGGGAIRVSYLDLTLVQHTTVVFAGHSATLVSVCADITGSTAIIYVMTYNSGTSTGYGIVLTQSLVTITGLTEIITSGAIVNLTSSAANGECEFFYETTNAYSYDSSIPTNFVTFNTLSQAGSVGTAEVLVRSVGLASKAFVVDGNIYVLCVYNSSYQPTYFLVFAPGNTVGSVYAKLAYSNAGGYLTLGLPSALVDPSGNISIAYLIRDLIEPVNKTQGASNAGLGVYAQTGINLASFMIPSPEIDSAEIGSSLNVSGGFVWMYDGFQVVEQNFFVWPDNVELNASTSGGFLTAQQYFYAVTYEWSDNQGNIHRSAPSIPVTVTTTGSTSSVVVNVPTLRLTFKTSSPVRITIYRWSTGQQTYYEVGSVANSKTADQITFTDTLADSSIIGNQILYTTGGVVEDISPPATSIFTLFDSRLWLVDAEDPNLLWYSKAVIEAVPVEFSDLFTFYVSPTQSAQGSTGPVTALSVLDEKLIIFKKDAIYYVNGSGPDNTGANSTYSDPTFITSTVGSANQQSIVFIPNGLMFQSDKGIWLLGRDLSTSYIGAPVEDFNEFQIQSSVNVPGTNYVLFTLSNGVTLMYDYYFNQWGTFVGVPSISSTLYQSLHTFINKFGQVFQESPGLYLDGSNPVLMQFTTGWINLAGLQGYERAYYFMLLGTFMSPHKLVMQIAYDYAPAPSQQSIITPFNYNNSWGGDATWGQSNPWGGTPSQEQWKIHLQRQTCQAFQISLQEIFDPIYGTDPGAGLTLSGINMQVGLKKGFRPIGQQRSVG